MLIKQEAWVLVAVTEENKAFDFLKVEVANETLHKHGNQEATLWVK